jgi:hypothetical protein
MQSRAVSCSLFQHDEARCDEYCGDLRRSAAICGASNGSQNDRIV